MTTRSKPSPIQAGTEMLVRVERPPGVTGWLLNRSPRCGAAA